MTEKHEYYSLLDKALKDLHEAEKLLEIQTIPETKIGRFKVYTWIHPNVKWPVSNRLGTEVAHRIGGVVVNGIICDYTSGHSKLQLMNTLIEMCRGQPRKILQVIYRIMATEKWCTARTCGRKKAAEEILRQQARAVKALEELSAMNALGGLGGKGSR